MQIPIYSKADLLRSIVSDIVEAWIIKGDYPAVREKIKTKFFAHVLFFFQSDCMPDGERVKKLEGKAYEFRITLDHRNLLRIIFHMEHGELVLTTGHLIKGDGETYDKRTKAAVDGEYAEQIRISTETYTDFRGSQQLDYVCLDEYVNP